jgi:hypothetical protein
MMISFIHDRSLFRQHDVPARRIGELKRQVLALGVIEDVEHMLQVSIMQIEADGITLPDHCG